MRWACLVGIVVAVVSGCAPGRPEKLHTPRPRPRPRPNIPIVGFQTTIVIVPAPDLQLDLPVPDFHDELRWPLSSMSHPSLEPRFPIAQVFAQPGVGWLALCGLGVQNRFGGDKELLAYLRGWCSAIDGDVDAALRNLVPLLGSTSRGIEPAVRTDLANILANDGHADHAEHFINIYNIWDVGLLDILAANYVEVGTTEDALTINRHAIDSDDHATASTKCMRWTKQILLVDDRQSPLLKQIAMLATQPRFPDATCVREHHKLTCWADGFCTPFYEDRGVSQLQLDLSALSSRWALARQSSEWTDVAINALKAGLDANPMLRFAYVARLAKPGRSALAFARLGIAALENSVATARECRPYTAGQVAAYVRWFGAVLDAEWRARLDALMARCAKP